MACNCTKPTYQDVCKAAEKLAKLENTKYAVFTQNEKYNYCRVEYVPKGCSIQYITPLQFD